MVKQRAGRHVYGVQFSQIYDAGWGSWTQDIWPTLHEAVRRRAPQARSWLDLCCGCGHLLWRAAGAGFEVVGVDRSKAMLRCARRNAPAARLVRADVRDFDLGREFDVVTCMYDSLNYLTSVTDLGRALRRAKAHLARPGCFIFDVNAVEGFRAKCPKTNVKHGRDWSMTIEITVHAKRPEAVFAVTGFVRRGRWFERFRERHVERLYSAGEVDRALERVGLRFVRFDARTLDRPRKSSDRLVYVCRR